MMSSFDNSDSNSTNSNNLKAKSLSEKKKNHNKPKLSLDLPTTGVFYFYKEEDTDEGSLYYPATLFYKLYKKKEKLGEGTAGLARRYINRSTKESVSVKITRTRDDEIFFQIKNEFEKMRNLNHESVIDFRELYYDELKGKIFCVMEYFKGIDMEVRINQQGVFQEIEAKVLFYQLLQGVMYLHSRGVVHRDLKPSNLLISKEKVKILDFNVAHFQKDNESYCCFKWDNIKMTDITGTLTYSAPETGLENSYTEAVDAWSLGCILYEMLVGVHPFYSEKIDSFIHNITKEDFNKEHQKWVELSAEAQNLITGLLDKNPKERLKIIEALNHNWVLNMDGISSPTLSPIQNQSFKTFTCATHRTNYLKGQFSSAKNTGCISEIHKNAKKVKNKRRMSSIQNANLFQKKFIRQTTVQNMKN